MAALFPGVSGKVFVLLCLLETVTVKSIGVPATAEVIRVTIVRQQGPLRSSVEKLMGLPVLFVLNEDILDKDTRLGLACPTGSCGDFRFSSARSHSSCITAILILYGLQNSCDILHHRFPF